MKKIKRNLYENIKLIERKIIFYEKRKVNKIII